MMGAAGDGLHDRLMEFTTPASGANFFAPSLNVLRSLPRLPRWSYWATAGARHAPLARHFFV